MWWINSWLWIFHESGKFHALLVGGLVIYFEHHLDISMTLPLGNMLNRDAAMSCFDNKHPSKAAGCEVGIFKTFASRFQSFFTISNYEHFFVRVIGISFNVHAIQKWPEHGIDWNTELLFCLSAN
jgi:hypothetical protein